MGRLKKACAIIYLLAFAVVLAVRIVACGAVLPRCGRAARPPAFQAFLAACMAICALQALYVLGRVVFDKPEPRCIHPQGATDLEVTASALEAVARTAARDEDVLVDRVLVRIRGRAHDALYVTIEAYRPDDTASRRARRSDAPASSSGDGDMSGRRGIGARWFTSQDYRGDQGG